MATPARLAQGSTPKSAPVVTPSNITSSPHASNTAPPPKGISHKSPAIKTPSSLGHGHAHTLSASSHPSSTSLAAMMSGEDPISFNSPATAAVIAQLGTRGLTPVAGGNDGLGISSDGLGLKTTPSVATRNPEEERLQRLRQAIEDLKPKVSSHGICREGMENLGPIAGFAPFWQEDTLTIAGDHLVDLEIEFEGAKSDMVKDVSLKIGAPGSPEATRNDAASRVLSKNLSESSHNTETPWRDLREFSANLERLGNLDRLSHGVNCFKALEGLEDCFVRYWNEEQKHKPNLGPLSMLSSGAIGRPVLHEGNIIGLGLEYWATHRKLREARSRRGAERATEIDLPPTIQDSEDSTMVCWTARIDCEAGFPPLHVSKTWIAEEVLATTNVDVEAMEMQPLQPAWLDPRATGTDTMAVDSLNVRFVAKLDPPVRLPVMVVSSVFDQTLAGPWIQKPIKPLESILSDTKQRKSGSVDLLRVAQSDPDSTHKSNSWTKTVSSVDAAGNLKNQSFEYRLKSEQNMWCYSVDDIPFEHPRQITQLFPIFRQYALLWTLLKSLTCTPETSIRSNLEENAVLPSHSSGRKGFHKSNKTNSDYAKLEAILGKQYKKSSKGNQVPSKSGTDVTVVDVSVRFSPIASQQPCIDLFFSPPLLDKSSNPTMTTGFARSCLISVEIALNGDVTVVNVETLPSLATNIMRKKMAEILELSEDLTVLVAWVLQQQP